MTYSDFLPASKPVLWDARSCDEWLARAPLADSHQACSAFLSLLEELEDAPPRHAAYLQIIERLREPILIVQEEHARRFAFKPLPLGHAESAAFGRTSDLWMALLRSYRRLLRAALKGRPELPVALLCERAIECTGELIAVRFLAHREVGADLWQWLHEAYALAERRGVADVAVPEPGARIPPSSTCTAAYARPLMLALARPYGLSERELTWSRHWAHRWAAKVKIVPQSGLSAESGYQIDLTTEMGPQWQDSRQRENGRKGHGTQDDGIASIHLLDFADVSRSIKWRLKKLEDGALPADLGLGRNCVQPDAGRLLAVLLACWTRPPKARQFPRHAAHVPVEFASGMARIHAALGGEVIVTDIRHWDYNHRDAEQIHTSQHVAEFETRHPRLEQWHTLDESACGFSLRRTGPGERLGHRQLVALRPRGEQQFILCELRWLMQSDDRALTVGARALGGLAQPVSVRPLTQDRTAPFSYGVSLAAAGGLPASVLLPGGWHQEGRMLEMRSEGRMLRIRLTERLARGCDFDHACFETMNA